MSSTIPVFRGKNPLLPGAEFLRDPFRFSIGRAREVGDFFRIPFIPKNLPAGRQVYFTTNIEVIKHVLQGNQKNYVKSVAYRYLKMALGNGLVTSEGEHWRRNRRLIQPAFYKTQLEGLYNVMAGIAERYSQGLLKKIGEGAVVEITEELMSVTADIALKTLFSADNPADISEMYRIMVEAQEYIVQRTVKPYLTPLAFVNGRHRRFRRDMDWFDGHIFNLINERRKNPQPVNDLLSMLLHARYEDTGEPMDDRQVRDEAVTLFAAGHETSSNALAWTLYLLAQHPEILKKLRKEVDETLGGKTPAFSDLRKLGYTMQVIQEGMRLYPPAFAIGREPLADDEILGVKIPKGSVMFLSICGLHRDPKYWERPDEFYPSHFLPENEKKRPKMAYAPFGAGPRMCIGNHFALMEMQLLLATLVCRVDLELATSEQVAPQPLITLKPKNGIKLRLRPRKVFPPV
ncbi:MAG TPA: cytochrome P450 [Bacteroidetes bacterium]|nr:cytochrome P450 [Bacteroidota bacterium]